jgi:hypothetical protein
MTMFIVGSAYLWAEHNYLLPSSGSGQKFHGGYPFHEMVLVWATMVAVCIFWVMNVNLLVLHIYLIRSGKTTYEWLFPGRKAEKLEINYRNKGNSSTEEDGIENSGGALQLEGEQSNQSSNLKTKVNAEEFSLSSNVQEYGYSNH